MFSSKTAQSFVAAAACAAATSLDLEALDVNGSFPVGLRLIPGLEPSDRSTWESHVTQVRGVPCIALGNGAFATAAHVRPPQGSSDHYRVRSHDNSPCDLQLFRHTDAVGRGDPLAIAETINRSAREVLLIATSTGQGLVYPTSATNVLTGGRPSAGLNPPLVLLSPKYGLPGAATVEVGDSGGGVFRFDADQRRWLLVGIVAAKATPSEQHAAPELTQGSYAVAIDTTIATGVGKQLLDYRDGAIRGGDLAGRFESSERIFVGVSVAGLLAVGAASLFRARSKKSST